MTRRQTASGFAAAQTRSLKELHKRALCCDKPFAAAAVGLWERAPVLLLLLLSSRPVGVRGCGHWLLANWSWGTRCWVHVAFAPGFGLSLPARRSLGSCALVCSQRGRSAVSAATRAVVGVLRGLGCEAAFFLGKGLQVFTR